MRNKSKIRENPEEFDQMFQKYVNGEININEIIERFHIKSGEELEKTKNEVLSEKDKMFNQELKKIYEKAMNSLK